MQKRIILRLALLFLFLSVHPLYADPTINVSLSTDKLSQDQTALLTLQIDWPKSEGSYGFGVPSPDLENLSLVRRGESQEFFAKEGKDWIRKTFELELKPLGPGKASVREFTVTYTDTVTQRQGNFQVSALQLKVGKNLPALNPVLLSGVLGFILLTGIGAMIVLRKNKKARPDAALALSEEEKRALKIRSIMDSGNPSKESFHQIAAEFRDFLTDHYKIGNLHATEDEIIKTIKSQEIPYEEWQKIQSLLQRIQEAKYLPEQSAGGDFKYLPREILSFIESKKTLESLSRN